MSDTAITREPTLQELEVLSEMREALAPVVAEANGLQVRTPEEAEVATEFLAYLAREKRARETARVANVKPLNDHVKWLNTQFKDAALPLETADEIVRPKVKAFQAEQDRLRQEQEAELRRVEERQRQEAEDKRRDEEAQARQEREAAAREAVRQQQEAQARENARQRALSDRQREIEALTKHALLALAGGEDEEDARLARGEIAARARRAQEAREAEEARLREEKLRAEEEELRNRPVETPRLEVAAAAPPKGLSSRKRWVATVVDPSKVPWELMDPSMPRINEKMRELVREMQATGEALGSIPGVKIEQEAGLAIRAK